MMRVLLLLGLALGGCGQQATTRGDRSAGAGLESAARTAGIVADADDAHVGVRSDDARRVVLAGEVPAWEVRTLDVPGVILTMALGDDVLTVFSMVNLVHEPYRSTSELATIARGIAETYTAR